MTELHNHLLKISGELGKAVDLEKIDIKTAVNLNGMLSEAINFIPCCTELPIYMTYDNSDSEVFAAFTDKERCELESQESGVPMQKTILYFGKRK